MPAAYEAGGRACYVVQEEGVESAVGSSRYTQDVPRSVWTHVVIRRKC